MQEYDSFAPYYDGVMGDRSLEIGRIRQLLSRYHPQAQNLLELGCGTGAIIAGLAPLIEVSGLERSAAMLSIAQNKLLGRDIRQGDITDFSFGRQFDAVICVFDTINHITRFDGWERVFDNAYQHLTPGGIFLFDMITTGRIKAVTGAPYYHDDEGDIEIAMDIEGIADNEIEWHINVQSSGADGMIEAREEHFREASFPLTSVEAAIRSRFELLHFATSEGRRPTDRSARVYCIGRRTKD